MTIRSPIVIRQTAMRSGEASREERERDEATRGESEISNDVESHSDDGREINTNQMASTSRQEVTATETLSNNEAAKMASQIEELCRLVRALSERVMEIEKGKREHSEPRNKMSASVRDRPRMLEVDKGATGMDQ